MKLGFRSVVVLVGEVFHEQFDHLVLREIVLVLVEVQVGNQVCF